MIISGIMYAIGTSLFVTACPTPSPHTHMFTIFSNTTAGDCRAVLGQKHAKGKGWKGIALSEDHNAKMPKEMKALTEAHPGETDIVKCKHANACYVKGRLQPTRYGDKRDKEIALNV